MPTKKRKPRQTPIPDEKFVTKFLAVMQRFPACKRGEISLDEEYAVNTFFYRMVQFTNRGRIEFKPRFLLMAFMIVSFPDVFLSCHCNPFRQSLIYRSLGFVGAVFQATMDCSQSEDDSRADFLPLETADNFATRLNQFLEVLRLHRRFLVEKPCCCQGAMLHF